MARILCLDDDPLILSVMVRTLNVLGHEVVTVCDGQQALELGAREPFALALVDFDLKQAMNGLAVLRALRDLQPECMRVLMTGGQDASIFVNAVNEGEIARVLPKPFRTEDVRVAIDAVLELGRHQRVAALSRAAEANAQRAVAECLSDACLHLASQPIVELSTGRVTAVECLVRPQHPHLQSALQLIAAAELSGRLWEVGALIFALVAQRPHDGLPLFVNVHPAQFGDPLLFRRLEPLLGRASSVILEITEQSDLQSIPGWELTFEQLIEAGFQFAIDDLGAGYSNLALLSDLRPAFIKVDMSMVRDVHLHSRKQRLIEMLVGFANATGSKLVAEGVESRQEAQALLALGTHFAQGYYFARPALGWSMGHTSSGHLPA